MELNSKMTKEERFSYHGLSVTDHRVITLKGSIQRKEIKAISTNNDKNYINVNLENQLLILEPIISVRKIIFDQKEYNISHL